MWPLAPPPLETSWTEREFQVPKWEPATAHFTYLPCDAPCEASQFFKFADPSDISEFVHSRNHSHRLPFQAASGGAHHPVTAFRVLYAWLLQHNIYRIWVKGDWNEVEVMQEWMKVSVKAVQQKYPNCPEPTELRWECTGNPTDKPKFSVIATRDIITQYEFVRAEADFRHCAALETMYYAQYHAGTGSLVKEWTRYQ